MDAETFKTIFMPFRHKLFGIALRLTGNSEDAEDAVQEAYARFWERRMTIARNDSPEAYCVATLRNICLDMIRRRRDTEPVENAAAIFIAVVCMMKLQEPETGPRSSNIYVVTNPHEAKKLLETVNESYALLSERCRAAVAETDSILNSNIKNNIKQQR